MPQGHTPRYLGDLTGFVALMDEYSKEKWTLNKWESGFWLKQSVMVRLGGEPLNRQCHILRCAIRDCPVLWFNFYHRDGRPLRLDEIRALLARRGNFDSDAYFKNVTQEPHPYYGVLFFFVDPVETPGRMAEMPGHGNYIVRWLSIYGPPIDLRLPDEVLLAAGLTPSRPSSLNGCSAFEPFEKPICESINEENEDERETVVSSADTGDSAHDSPVSSGS
ncbi:unnamed protein product, partial [Mesorhabditis spiculigera]